MSAPLTAPHRAPWRVRLHTVIFGHETTAGKAFDVALLVAIVASVGAVMADSVPSLRSTWGTPLRIAEWTFTLLFSIEYVLRLACAERPTRYATSFFGLIDLAALLPTYLSLVAPGSQYLIVIRGLRVLRVFRILALAEYVGEAEFLGRALRDSRRKIAIFMATVATLTVMLGTLMYLIEGERSGFTSIPTMHLLDHRHHHDRGIRGHHPADTIRAVAGRCHHAVGLRDRSDPDRHCHGGTRAREAAARRLSAVPDQPTRPRCRILPTMWRGPRCRPPGRTRSLDYAGTSSLNNRRALPDSIMAADSSGRLS